MTHSITFMYRQFGGIISTRPANPTPDWANQFVANFNFLVDKSGLGDAEKAVRKMQPCRSCAKKPTYNNQQINEAIVFAEHWYYKLLHS